MKQLRGKNASGDSGRWVLCIQAWAAENVMKSRTDAHWKKNPFVSWNLLNSAPPWAPVLFLPMKVLCFGILGAYTEEDSIVYVAVHASISLLPQSLDCTCTIPKKQQYSTIFNLHNIIIIHILKYNQLSQEKVTSKKLCRFLYRVSQ